MNAIKLVMNAKSGHMKHINESKFYILAMLKHKVEGHVLKSTTLKLNADSSSSELETLNLSFCILLVTNLLYFDLFFQHFH